MSIWDYVGLGVAGVALLLCGFVLFKVGQLVKEVVKDWWGR